MRSRQSTQLTVGSGGAQPFQSGHLSNTSGRSRRDGGSSSSSKADRISREMNSDGEALRKKLMSCGSALRDKLFLASYDIMSVNLSPPHVYQLYIVLDFIFLGAFPLNHIYNYSQAGIAVKDSKAELGAPFLRYLIPTDFLYDQLPFLTNLKVAYCMVAFIVAVALTLVVLVATRSRQRLSTESPERKVVNKAVGLVLCITYFLLFVPITTFISPFLVCSKEIQAASLTCYQGEHLTIFCFVVLALTLHLFLIMYSSFMLTTNYPHERIPWGHFPSNAPFYKLLARFPIVLVYQLDTLERSTLVYFNVGLALLMVIFVWQRLTKAMTFDHQIHYMQLTSESTLAILFLVAFLADVIPKMNPLSSLFTISLVLGLVAAAYFVTLVQEGWSERFIMRGVDIFSYTSETEALRMMFALNRLIVVSAERPREEFVLRGFVERHIEICDFPQCNCLEYYKVINSGYRLQLATVASMKEDVDPHNSSHKDNKHMRQQQSQTTQNPRGSNTGRVLTTDDEAAGNYSGDDTPSLLGGTSSGSGPQGRLFFLDGGSGSNQRINKARARFLHTFLINNIKVFIELFPNSLKLRYMSAYIYYSLFKNSFKALYELSYNNSLLSSTKGGRGESLDSPGTSKSSPSLAFLCGCGKGGDAYNSYTLGLRIIEQFGHQVGQFLSKESKIVDMECDLAQIIEFEKLNIKYQKSIERTSEISEQFWVELSKKGGLNVDTIFNLGATINQRFHQIKRLYRRLMSINQNYLEVAYLYKLFVQLCLNFELEESEAKLEITKILQSKGMRKRNLRLEYAKINFQDENGMIIISGCQKDFSQILAMNNKAERIFGYSTAELIDQPLQKLQPFVFAKSSSAGGTHSAHDDFIMNYINSQKRRRIRKEQHRFIWGKHKSGFIMPIVMDISPYVTYEHNLCFISFCKRSILLEMTPLKEIIDAQDVFVLLADQRGVITDMTRNVTDWLGFPHTALQRKEVVLEQVFDGILDEENEKDFSDGKRIDFFMNSFKDALDDYENRSEPDLLAGGSGGGSLGMDPLSIDTGNREAGNGQGDLNHNDIGLPPGGGAGEDLDSTLYMKDKKCRALVWMKIHEYALVNSGGVNPTSVASPTNGFVSFQAAASNLGQIILHASNTLQVREIWFVLLEEEAATATNTASIMDSKNTHDTGGGGGIMDKEELKFTYQEDREEISSLASISSLAGYNSTDKGLINKLSEIKTSTVEDQKPQAITFLQQALVGVFILSVVAAIVMLAFSLSMTKNFSKDLGFVTSATFATINYQNLQILTRDLISLANQEQPSFPLFPLPQMSLERNSSDQAFLQGQIAQQVESFRNLLLDIDDHSFLQSEAGKVMDRDFKQKKISLQYLRQDGLIYQDRKSFLLSIYELMNSWSHITSQKSLQALSFPRPLLNAVSPKNGVPNPQLSNLTATQRQQVYFLLNNSREADLNYYPMRLAGYLVEQARDNMSAYTQVYLVITIIASAVTFMTALSVIPIIVRIESNKEKVFFIYAELSRNDIDDRKRNIRVFFAKLRQSTQNPGGSLFYEKSSRIVSSKLVTRRFSNREGDMPSGNIPPSTSGGKGLSRMSGGMNAGGGLVRQNVRGLAGASRGTSQGSGMRSRVAIGSLLQGGDVDYEEDLQAEIMKQKEEQEAAAFKRFFHSRIKAMSCIKKLKHVALVLLSAAVVCAYFLIKRTMIQDIEQTVHASIQHYQVVAARPQLLGQLISEFRESMARNMTFPAPKEAEGDLGGVSSIDYFLNQTLDNELQYNRLRQSLPDILSEAASLIRKIEGEELCNVAQTLNSSSSLQCSSLIDGVMQTGVTQIINSFVKEVVQSQITFERIRARESGLRQVLGSTKIRGIIYLKIIYLDSVLEHLVSNVQTSIGNYISKKSLSLIILFVSFFLLLLIGVAITATLGMNYLLRNFNATKSILNFIPGKCLIELSDKTELKKIQF